jgi:hypothetical protein
MDGLGEGANKQEEKGKQTVCLVLGFSLPFSFSLGVPLSRLLFASSLLCTIRIDSWTIMSYLGIPLENH